MAAPVVQFAPMPDGGRVAFHVLGKGPAVALLFPYHVNHLTLNWRVPLHRGAIRFLARHFTVINLDFRGAGLSDPLNCELSLDSLRDALDTVRAKVGVQALGLCAMGAAGLIACHFASRMPHRVTSIVFIGSGESEANRQLLHIRQATPDVEAVLRGALLGGVGDKRNAVALAHVARASLDPGALAQWEHLLEREKLLPVAAGVAAPALYLHAADDHLVPRAAAEALVARLANAALRIVPGKSAMDVWRNRAAVQDVVRFLSIGQQHGDTVPVRLANRPGKATYPAGLSEREVEVVRLLAQGRTNRQIADDLFISLNTVSYHLRNIFSKTRASNRTEAAAFAFQAGLATRA
jgi:DNA-binding CsgD family transcriptional regulator/pimeloyl-ACP methyl ester carboxylesterase